MTDKKPKLSIVTISRNDNYGGDLLVRLQNLVDTIFELSEKYRFFVELIFVEWNPPEDRPRFAEAISWEKQGEHCVVRIIEVPAYIHAAYNYSDKLMLYEFIAKNVGIRRARGEFVLSTNGDIIISEELFRYLAAEELDKNTLYRTDRVDVENGLPAHTRLDERLEHCKGHVVKINDNNNPKHILEICNKYGLKGALHCNGCGDFQLMSRECWEKLRGFPEMDMYPFCLDSFLEYLAFYNGISERVICEENADAVIFHVAHNSIARLTDYDEIHIWFRRRGIYCLSHTQLMVFCASIFENRDIDHLNGEGWGMRDYSLQETTIKLGKTSEVIQGAGRPYAHDPKKICDTNRWITYIEKASVKFFFGGYPLCKWFKLLNARSQLFDSEILTRGFYKRFFGALGLDKTKLIIFGTGGAYMLYTRSLLDRFGIAPYYFVDNDARKTGRHFEDAEIRSPEVLLSEDKNDIYILIASEYYVDIRDQLIEMGFTEYLDFAWYYKANALEYLLCRLLLAANKDGSGI